MIQTVDNYQTIENNTQKYYFRFEGTKTQVNNDKKFIREKLEINLNDYQIKSPNNTFFSFFKDEEKIRAKNEDDLIISIKKDGENYLAQTGNYVGKFVWQGLEIDIKSRFSNTFLERMLNFANDIFLDDVSITGNKVDKDFDISKYIIYYMFIQNLEKAFLLGLPKAYKSIEHHEMKLKGKIDINKFIKYDIPFQGKISSVSREQKEIQEIIDVLYKAVKIIDKNNKAFLKNISHIKTHLKQYKSNNYVSNETINRALKSKALQNPIFAPYKKVLEYARFIINGNSIKEKNDGKQETFGFIINVAELFEIYITKLLQKEFRDWNIESPKIELYSNQFFARKIIPDIVMKKDNDVIVFDTKYKKMLMRDRYQNGGDVDRNDFFQINTYMSYYQNQNQNYNVKIGGLLYPIEKSFIENKYICHSETWFGNLNTKFIVDGIDLSDLKEDNENKFSQIVIREKEFINRIKKLLD
ncbi:McrC family protein [Aliarcobacter cryaerophilus]|uniref:McrC family protein n=1 Tax=Aliarcobacter cryaerophilus TaxID=28198 RepID=UPI0021B15A49|nr:McrC family protein [Aliarcobacter cryaerophilus]MCT7500068.1 McrC family protein [Aliarcobacter cryaerophilus]MCT7506516.1 McrC family protein [Aliarcobacter cryaerophilus]MCT7544318.1 McrC family protein [Aliarcobacter cryaerophilus]